MADNTSIREFLNLPYISNSDDKYHQFDLYVPEAKPSSQAVAPPLLIFVHGGAWRSEDKADHSRLASRLASLTSFPVAVPNYRLTTPSTPDLRHPSHTEDLHTFLNFLLDWPGPQPNTYNPSALYAIGHSCSAHMLTSIFLSPSSPTHTSIPTLVPSPRLLSSIKAFILSSGIYDIDLLLRSFPAYKAWFIADTFGTHDSYAPWSTMDRELRKGLNANCKWFVIHSTGDTLVDVIQSEGMLSQLRQQGVDDVELNRELTEEHNDTLKGDVYPGIVSRFVLGCENK
ncbi:Alpha/Beta hydrolase protein [Cytidiella melzeri]|nr:Alpha/Beta hydrolase protein [Cytidiella melzeri]